MLCVNFRDEYNRIFFEDTSQMYSVVSINLEKLEKVYNGPTETKTLFVQELYQI